jgi:hypothetical protein
LINKKDDGTLIRSGDLGAYVPGFPLKIVDEGTVSGAENIYGVKILDTRQQPRIPGL